MRDNYDFTGGVRGKYSGDSGRRESGGKKFAKQKAEGQGCGSSQCLFVEMGAEDYAKV